MNIFHLSRKSLGTILGCLTVFTSFSVLAEDGGILKISVQKPSELVSRRIQWTTADVRAGPAGHTSMIHTCFYASPDNSGVALEPILMEPKSCKPTSTRPCNIDQTLAEGEMYGQGMGNFLIPDTAESVIEFKNVSNLREGTVSPHDDLYLLLPMWQDMENGSAINHQYSLGLMNFDPSVIPYYAPAADLPDWATNPKLMGDGKIVTDHIVVLHPGLSLYIHVPSHKNGSYFRMQCQTKEAGLNFRYATTANFETMASRIFKAEHPPR